MRVVVAPDKFKGSLTAPEAALAMARGVASAWPGATVDLAPMADGGEGTVEALVAATGGTFHEAIVDGPLGEPVAARFGLLGDGATAVLEMAAASGLALVPAGLRDPSRASTFGTGELLRAALDRGATSIVLGIGGSATNDGGAGLAQALGARLLDAEGRELPPGGLALLALDRIDASGLDPRLARTAIRVACDVANPLRGPSGASAVYGPQKGASPALVLELDAALGRFASVVARDLGLRVADLPGSGAAGGLGAGLVAFAGGVLTPGVDLVIDAVGLAGRLDGADLCLTGEGCIDASSAFGKTAVGVARLARSMGVPCLALAGMIGDGADAVLSEGIDAFASIAPGPGPLDRAIAEAALRLERATEQFVRAFRAGLPRPEPVPSPPSKEPEPMPTGDAPSGEFDLIARFRARAVATERVALGIGDDCASIRFAPGAEVLVTTDMILEGRHFERGSASPRAIGRKALGVNLSDIAAMAGRPVAAVVAVALPRGEAAEVGTEVFEGMAAMAEEYGVALVGGDTNAWDGPLVVSVTLFGEATGRGPVRRSGARPGDVVFVTGLLGGSRLRRHLEPSPRIGEALALHDAVELRAMIDVSDGLASDLAHILDESGGLGAVLDVAAIPIHPEARALAALDGVPPLEHALGDGEDFELCFTVGPDDADRLLASPPPGLFLHRIGAIDDGPGLRLRDPEGRVVPCHVRGFDHLAGGA